MENSLISVVIPTYNRANLIEKTIYSVINQTYNNLEILIIDDGSKDNTEEVIKNINDQRIIYIYQENAGPSAARNNGIRNANGEYIAFLDSDDLWLSEKIEKQVKIAESNPNIGIICCFGMRYNPDNPKNQVSYNFCTAKNSENFLEGLLSMPDKVVTGTSTMFIKKEAFDKSGYFETEMRAYEDWDVFFKAALNYEFYCINEILVHQLTKADSIRNYTDIETLAASRFKFLQNVFNNKNLPERILKKKNKVYSDAFNSLGWIALYGYKNTSYSKKYLLKSFKYSPAKIFSTGFLVCFALSFLPEKAINSVKYLRNKIKILKRGSK